ncbi:protein TPRXL [Pyrus ussuriensis x Pyrus communis]|uniref:Protein TPRXL n=1 Tax=Pyrus ussuriensis x Pyrus communis TaxID=2448454 RepID=A0A5N5HQ99_9ROSA|nr:protein TPRXL [Pyrus ussuriensis x Pyrus communis]
MGSLLGWRMGSLLGWRMGSLLVWRMWSLLGSLPAWRMGGGVDDGDWDEVDEATLALSSEKAEAARRATVTINNANEERAIVSKEREHRQSVDVDVPPVHVYGKTRLLQKSMGKVKSQPSILEHYPCSLR